MDNILVTGGAGYVGAHCCKALARTGFQPVVFDNLSTGHRNFVRWGPLVLGDIRHESALIAAMRDHNVKAVIHLAAVSLVGESMRQPAMYFDVNVKGSLCLISAMRLAGVDKLIFSSTGAVYGSVDDQELIDETQSCNPINPYGLSKFLVERVLQNLRNTGQLRSFALRYFNASGADHDMEIGERRAEETHLIPLAMDAVLFGKKTFAIFGDDYGTRDGTAIRDYIHVADLAKAHVAALKALFSGMAGASLNLGTSRGITVREVLTAIENETGSPLISETQSRREGDPQSLVANASAAKDVLAFVPIHSDLTQIIKTAWNWRLKDIADGNAVGMPVR